jgi:hypothetical protein
VHLVAPMRDRVPGWQIESGLMSVDDLIRRIGRTRSRDRRGEDVYVTAPAPPQVTVKLWISGLLAPYSERPLKQATYLHHTVGHDLRPSHQRWP